MIWASEPQHSPSFYHVRDKNTHTKEGLRDDPVIIGRLLETKDGEMKAHCPASFSLQYVNICLGTGQAKICSVGG
jgi:hypothetical protein